MELETFYEAIASDKLGPGYNTHEIIRDEEGWPVAIRAVFMPMPNGRFEAPTIPTVLELKDGTKVEIQIAVGRYLSKQENAEADARDAAWAPIGAAMIKKEQLEQAILSVGTHLKHLFQVLTEDEQAEFASDFDSVERRLEKGDVKGARNIVKAKKPQTVNGLGVQGAILEELDKLLLIMVG